MKEIVFLIRHSLVVFTPIVLIFLPANYFDHGQSVCLSKSLAGIECWGCGSTRAAMHLLHLNFETAWNYNKMIFFIMPLLIIVWLKSVFQLFKIKQPKYFDYL
ncbi:DUF2752 domain-containing protein [Capnocytophaga sp. ARDL2]|uniref:DUF2752 domain-containing protein n=1 Tax=Capnocytophaga sp. ARDL2 TaxID=3238809 RepID=UPI003557EB8D